MSPRRTIPHLVVALVGTAGAVATTIRGAPAAESLFVLALALTFAATGLVDARTRGETA